MTSAVNYEYKITVSSRIEDGMVLFMVEDSNILYQMDSKKFMDLEKLIENWATM